MKTDRESTLQWGGIIAMSLSVVLLMFGALVTALASATVGVLLLLKGTAAERDREERDRKAAEARAAENEAENQRWLDLRTAEDQRRIDLQMAEEQRRKDSEIEEEQRRKDIEERERLRCEWRDADVQDIPYEYECVGHPNRTLALRHGIANEKRKIRVRKLHKVSIDEEGTHYLAELPDFGDRKVRVVIQPGAEYIKTFYPISKQWFDEHADLEMILKDNPTFDLKELATFHVQAVLNAKR